MKILVIALVTATLLGCVDKMVNFNSSDIIESKVFLEYTKSCIELNSVDGGRNGINYIGSVPLMDCVIMGYNLATK